MKYTREDSKIVIGMHRLVNEMDHSTKVICKKHGVTFAQFAVMEALFHKGDLTVGEVKELVLSTDGTIPVVVGNLEKQGLILKTQDDKDKRKFILSLTEEGKKVISKIIPENEKALAEITGRLSKDEKLDLILYFNKMR